MEEKNLVDVPSIVRCLDSEEETFAIFEDNHNKRVLIGWGYTRVFSGSSDEVVQNLKRVLREWRLKGYRHVLLGYVSYDAVRLWERVRDENPYPEKWPYIELFEPRNLMIYDYASNEMILDVVDDTLLKRCRGREVENNEYFKIEFYDESLNRRDFERAVETALSYIRDGYVFQVVLSRFERYVWRGSLSHLYVKLRRVEFAPYTYYLRFGDRAVIGASPELLYLVRGGVVETYPIAGTRPRGATPDEDKRLEEELIKSEKDRAEHLMLVDLARNDLGKVCVPGSVKVERFMYIEKYGYVQHLVSKVVGFLRRRFDAIDVLKAVFPAGTVSGAPKPFAMNLIEELEEFKRGPYAGAVGYISSDEALMAIAIRSAFVNSEILRIQAGAGIVYDSKPELEYEETEYKLYALKKALGIH